MGELKSMKISAAERKARYAPSLATEQAEGPLYPWELNLTLRDEALEKLGIETLPKVGTALMLVARVEVTGVSSDIGADKQKRQSVSLQITDCCLEPEAKREAIEDVLYGKKDA
jgi:hypothetical protein